MKHRARYTLEFNLESVRLVKAGQEASVTARVLGMPKATLSNWVRLERGTLKKESRKAKHPGGCISRRARTFQGNFCAVGLDFKAQGCMADPGRPGGKRASNEARMARIRAVMAETKGEYGWLQVWIAMGDKWARIECNAS